MSASRTIRFFNWVSARKLVRDFSSIPSEPALPTFTQGTVDWTEHHFGEWDGRTQRWKYVTPPPGYRFAIGKVDDRPEAGTWTITDGVGTTPGIAHDADAAAVQAALAAATPGAIAGWTVTKPGTARWMFTATANGARALLSVSTAGLAPSSFADVYALQEGLPSVPEIQEVELFANPAGYQDTWEPLPAADVTVEVIDAGGAGNAQQRIVFDPVPVGGSYVLTMPNGSQTPVIDVFASESVILEAIQEVTAYAGDGDVAVSGSAALGEITISFQGTLAGQAQAEMGVRVNALQVPVGLAGELDLRTAAAKKLVRGQSGNVASTMEARAVEGGKPTVLASGTVFLRNGLIETTTQQAHTAMALLNAETGLVNGSAVGITGLTGGGSTNLDGVPTASMVSAMYVIATEAGTGVWELVGSQEPHDPPRVVHPQDFDLDNNARVWRLAPAMPEAVQAALAGGAVGARNALGAVGGVWPVSMGGTGAASRYRVEALKDPANHAFSASGWTTVTGYQYEMLDEGNCFDPSTGMFTAPVDGVYRVSVWGHGYMDSNTGMVFIGVWWGATGTENQARFIEMWNYGQVGGAQLPGYPVMLTQGQKLCVRLSSEFHSGVAASIRVFIHREP